MQDPSPSAHHDPIDERDHKKLGRRLGLFTLDEDVGQGLPLWKPHGVVIRQAMIELVSELLAAQGYEPVVTPHIGKLELYRRSGHYPYYADSQYPPILMPAELARLAEAGVACGELPGLFAAGEVDGYLLKPMNCPHHIRIYQSEPRSYRKLPVRLSEFGTVYRYEQSGEIGGLTRVRALTVDDAHIFCRPDQIEAELEGCLSLVRRVFEVLGLSRYQVRVGLREPGSPKYVGEQATWDEAEAICLRVAEACFDHVEAQRGHAAFYGPKIDFMLQDALGRSWQLGTVQLDYQLPERFGLVYTGADGREHRPVIVHRAPLGSLERFVGLLIEHFAGAFPLWLAPVQAIVLPVDDAQHAYAEAVRDALRAARLRVELDDASERLAARIRSAAERKVPYQLVVGGREAASGQVSVRTRGASTHEALPLPAFVERAVRERDSRAR